ncbi:MAG: HDOD domain-containing protein [Hahellaceae bacterium]|nr:HDOD domain-containing protein [Hahellaceae bacterium]MCP5210833.1 HDOD domain-containing protein [Hahellaceae bacterium]
MMQQAQLKLDNLKALNPLGKLTDEQLVLLASRAHTRHFKKRSLVLERGSADHHEYFLLAGTVVLEASDGRKAMVEAGSERARSALAHLQPRQYNVLAASDCEFLVVAEEVLAQLLKEAPSASYHGESRAAGGDANYELLMDFYADLKNNQFKLPSVPDIAFRIKDLIDKDCSSAEDIAKVVGADPAMVVKIIRACNSPLYRGFSEVESCRDAVVRLGMETTRQLVTIFSMRELFKTKRKELQAAMEDVWQRSRHVAAIAYVLAEITPGLNKDHALLAGLIHDIGAVPVICYAESYVDLWADEKNLREAIGELKGELGSTLLEHWGFVDNLIEVVNHSEDWLYESGHDKPNYADLVIVAKMHTLIGKPGQKDLPPFNSIPAFQKLANGGLTPQKSLKVLVEARHKIDEVLNLLGPDYRVAV